MGHRLPQGLDAVEVPLRPVAQICKAAGLFPLQQAVLIFRQLPEDGIQLLVVPPQPQQFPPPGHHLFQAGVVIPGEDGLLPLNDLPFQLIQMIHIPVQQPGKEAVEPLGVGKILLLLQAGKDLPGPPESPLLLTKAKEMLPIQIQQKAGILRPVAVDIVPVKGNEVKLLKALKGLTLALMEMPGDPFVHVGRHLPQAGEGQYHFHQAASFHSSSCSGGSAS